MKGIVFDYGLIEIWEVIFVEIWCLGGRGLELLWKVGVFFYMFILIREKVLKIVGL